MKSCGVPWCVALTKRRFCAAHRDNPKLRPEPLADDEELIDGAFGQCDDCSGSGDCEECRGTGECECECSHGHRCDHACDECGGDGKCQTCAGSGFGGVRKKAA